MNIQIFLLQIPKVMVNNVQVYFKYKKVEALLYYLLYKKQTSRSEVINLLWENVDTQIAYKNLRNTIYVLKKTFEYDIIVAEGNTYLSLNQDIKIECDLFDFFDKGDINAYKGNFLDQFTIKNNINYENWIYTKRLQLRELYLQKLSSLSYISYEKMEYNKAEIYSVKYLKEESLDESMVLFLMKIYEKQNLQYKIVNLYNELKIRLEDELGIQPLKSTTKLYYEIINGWRIETEDVKEIKIKNDSNFNKDIIKYFNSFFENNENYSFIIKIETKEIKKEIVNFIKSKTENNVLFIILNCYKNYSDLIWNKIILQINEYIQKDIDSPLYFKQLAEKLFFDINTLGIKKVIDVKNQILILLSFVSSKTKIILLFDNFNNIDKNSLDILNKIIRMLNNEKIIFIAFQSGNLKENLNSFIKKLEEDKIVKLL